MHFPNISCCSNSRLHTISLFIHTRTTYISACSEDIVVTIFVGVIIMGHQQVFTGCCQSHQQVFTIVVKVVPGIHGSSQKSSLGCRRSSDEKEFPKNCHLSSFVVSSSHQKLPRSVYMVLYLADSTIPVKNLFQEA